VEYKPSSMNTGDVFILDLGKKIFQWNGKEASRMEKQKAMDTTRSIRDQERKGKARVFIVDQDNAATADLEKEFWEGFGHPKPSSIAEATDDAEHESAQVKSIKLFHISSEGSSHVTVTEIKERPLKKEMLDTNDAYILNTGSAGVFAWVGRGADKEEKTQAMVLAQKFVKSEGLPDWTPISRLVEDGETPLFKQNFAVWPEPMSMPGMNMAPGMRRSKFVKKVFDPNSMVAKKEREAMRLPKEEEGSGKVTVSRIENIKDLVEVPRGEKGQFYAGDSYVILYEYKTPEGRDAAYIYFWQGTKSTQDEKAASAIQAKDLDDKMGGYPVQVRVVQNKEPPHFFKIFEGMMVVHDGGIGSGFKNVDEADYKDEDGTRLFHVRGTNDYNTRAIQVMERAESLNSGDVFILESPEQMYIWYGKGCSGDEREFARACTPKIHGVMSKNRSPETVHEGTEPPEFWKALGVENWEKATKPAHRPNYGGQDYSGEDGPEWRPPRLFHCTDARGYFWAEELFDFDQEDLIPEDCMILDTFAEVYVWLGADAKDNEKKDAMDLALKYVHTNPDRDADATAFLVVKQGQEPPNFQCHFFGWDPKKWSDGKTYEELVKEMMDSNPRASIASLTVDLGDEIEKFVPGGKIYTYEDLTDPNWKTLCEGVQHDSREQALSDEEFVQYFKKPNGDPITKDEFNGLPKWKQSGLKRKAKLF